MRVRTKNVPKDLQPITRAAVRFFAKHFLHPRTAQKVQQIRVVFLKFGKKDKDTLAACAPFFPDDGSRPVEFDLEFNAAIDDIRTREYIVNLFHELVHLRQYATGELRDLKNGDVVWRGKTYDGKMEYWLQPWEIEARGLETAVYKLFQTAHPEYGLKRFSKRYGGRARSSWAYKQIVPVRAKKKPVESAT